MVNSYEVIGDVVFINVVHKGETLKVEVDLDLFEMIQEEITGSLNIRHTNPKYGKCYYVYYNKRVDGVRYDLPLHRFLAKPADDLVVDHIDGNTLNNKMSNLRVVTQQQNCQNQRVRKNNSSGERGVCYDPKKERWIASVYVNRKAIRRVKRTFGEAVEAVRELRAIYLPYSIN